MSPLSSTLPPRLRVYGLIVRWRIVGGVRVFVSGAERFYPSSAYAEGELFIVGKSYVHDAAAQPEWGPSRSRWSIHDTLTKNSCSSWGTAPLR